LCKVGNTGFGDEVVTELAGQRGKFVTMWIRYDGEVPVSVKRVDGMVLDFSPDGSIDREKYASMESIAMNYVWEGLERRDGENVVPSANRFAFKQYRWDPTDQEVLAALAANGIRVNGRT